MAAFLFHKHLLYLLIAYLCWIFTSPKSVLTFKAVKKQLSITY